MTRLTLVFGCFCALTLAAFAQTGAANGSIRGIIQDPSNSAMVKAKIKARNLNTGYERETLSTSSGDYELPLLPVGTYEVTVDQPGFASYRQTGVRVELAKASLLDIALKVASAAETVNVTADASILTTNTVDVSGGLNQRSVENSPITSRNSFNLALFAPGFNGRRDDEFGNPTFAFGGLQRRAFLIDGIDNTQRGGPGRLGIFSPETLLEVKVIHNAMAAEYGRTVGGIINMVTRGGSNELHGAALTLQRRPGFIARPSLAAVKPFQQWATYSGQLGGPIKKDRLFYFVSGEYEPLDAPRPITISAANAAALKIPASDLGAAPFAQRFQTYLGRVDYQINDRNSVYARYSNFITPSKFNTSGGTTPRSAGNNFDDRNDTFAAQWTTILSPAAVNEFRVGFLRREFTRPPVSGTVGPVVAISGVATLFSNTSANQYYREAQFDFVDAFNYRWGRHQFKLGFDVATIGVTSGDRLLLQYSFSNLSQYLDTLAGKPLANGRPTNYVQITQDFGNNIAGHRTNHYNFFVQDDFRITPRLTVSYGLRYEYLAYPSLEKNAPLVESRSINNDGNNFAPRFGFAYRATRKTVVRGGYGLFYDTTNLRLISAAIRQNGARVRRYVVAGSDVNAPIYPAAFTAEPTNIAGVKPSVTNFAPDFRSLYTHQANVQVEREVLRDLSVTVGVQYYGGRRLPVLIDTNLGAPVRVLADGRPVYSSTNRPNTAFNQILQLRSIANSTYYGGFVSGIKRFSNTFQVSASYTLGWAFNTNDSTGDGGSNVSDSRNLRLDYGPSSSDQRHRFVLQGVWQYWGFTVAPNVTLTTAFPVTVSQGSDLNGDGINNDRPLFRGRNDTKGYGFKEVNLRVSRAFTIYKERYQLELIGEAENLLNSTNAACNAGGCTGSVINRFDATDFRRITSTVNSRQVQLGARFRF